MSIFPLGWVKGKFKFQGLLPQKQDEKMATCKSWWYGHRITVDSALVLAAFVTKKFWRSDAPHP